MFNFVRGCKQSSKIGHFLLFWNRCVSNASLPFIYLAVNSARTLLDPLLLDCLQILINIQADILLTSYKLLYLGTSNTVLKFA